MQFRFILIFVAFLTVIHGTKKAWGDTQATPILIPGEKGLKTAGRRDEGTKRKPILIEIKNVPPEEPKMAVVEPLEKPKVEEREAIPEKEIEEPEPLTAFTYENPKAARVTLAGDFNNWDKESIQMAKMEGGKWETRLQLKPGRYEYKFVMDGDWDKANKDPRVMIVKKDKRGPVAGPIEAAPKPVQKKEISNPEPPKPVIAVEPIPVKAAGGVSQTAGTIRYRDPAATAVTVAGDFNQWNPAANAMQKGADGVWEIQLPLAPGDYGYKIVVNGKDWKEDPDNPLKKDDGYGGKNSLLRVTDQKQNSRQTEAVSPTAELSPGAQDLGDGTARFIYNDPSADQVYLAGSFNNWLPDAWPMMKTDNGLWVMTVRLKAGIYTYKYYIGGVWRVDPANPKTKDVGYGPDSLIEVGAPSPGKLKVPTTFRVTSKRAKRVTLAGDFNNWDPGGIELRTDGAGVWEVTIELRPGTYEYKFLEDGDRYSLNKDNQKILVK